MKLETALSILNEPVLPSFEPYISALRDPVSTVVAELDSLQTQLTEYQARVEELEKADCEWWQEKEYYLDGNCWDTFCGNVHEFIEGGPKENEHNFCPYCGGSIKSRD